MIESVTSIEFSHFSASTDVDHGTKAGIFHRAIKDTLSGMYRRCSSHKYKFSRLGSALTTDTHQHCVPISETALRLCLHIPSSSLLLKYWTTVERKV